MTQLPTNRTTANTPQEHVDDHNTLHAQHDVWEPYSPDDDANFSSNSATHIPTQRAVKAYFDTNLPPSVLSYRGATNCSTNPNYPAAVKGDAYVVTVAGKIGGAAGTVVAAGDVYFATADNAGGTQAAVGSSWALLPHNLVGALLSANNLSDLASAASARTNLGLGTAATHATTDFAQTANNLSDVTATTARTNLGLGSAATQNTSAFLQPANNLSDVSAAATARTNLGLGTAATHATGDFAQTANNLSDVANAATSRTNLRARPTINVKDYGAVGLYNGTTHTEDDSTAIQNAINAAVHASFSGIGTSIFFPAGKYYIGTGLVHTGTNYGIEFVGEGSPGMSDDLASGCTQIIVGDNQWGLKLGTPNSGDYRGYKIRNLHFYELNAGKAYGGLQIIDSNQGVYRDCSFGRFTNSVSTTVASGSNGAALSASSTLNVTSTTGWPSAGAGYISTNGTAGGGGQQYHSFTYTGVSGNTLTGCAYNAPTTDTISTGGAVVAAVGVGILVNGRPNGTSGEASINTFDNVHVGTCTIGYLQLGTTSANRLMNCYFDGGHNTVDGSTIRTGSCGIRLVSGQILADGGNVQAYDTLIHICKANQENRINFRLEGWKTTGIQLEGDGGTASSFIGGFGQSNVSGKGPGLIINSGVTTAVVTADINNLSPIADNGTKSRYPMQTGIPIAGPAVAGSIIGRQPVYDLVNNLIGYLPIYDNISGIYLVNKIGNGSSNDTTGVTTLTRSVTVPVNVGDLILVGGGYGLNAANVTVTITDSRSNTYTVDQHTDGHSLGTTPHAWVASCPVTTALQVGDTITITYSSGVNHPYNYYYDFRGQAAASVKDVAAGTFGTSTSPSSGNLTTTAAGDLIFGVAFFNQAAATFTPGSTGSPAVTFTQQDTGGDSSKRIAVDTVTALTSGATYTFNGTLSSSVDWATAAVCYKKA